MIRAANHSSYPRIGDSPLDQQLRTALDARARGEATDDDVRQVEDEVTSIVVADQSRAFIGIVTDGMVRWDGPVSHVARHLEGLEPRGWFRWFDTHLHDLRPIVTGPVAHSRPFLVRDYQVAAATAEKPVKITLPGPVLIARLALDLHYGDRWALADAVAEALAVEITALAAAGARHFQLDEPLLCRYPEDLDAVAATASRVFAGAGEGATTVLSTYFGDLSPLADQLGRLPGTHLGLDFTGEGCPLDLLRRLPDDKGVALGLFDARSARQEDAADVAERLAPYRERLTSRDVIVGPQAGLDLLPRDRAFDKLLHARYLVEKLEKEWRWR